MRKEHEQAQDPAESLDTLVQRIRQALTQEQAGGPGNGLAAWQESVERRSSVLRDWQRLHRLEREIADALQWLPALPSRDAIRRAQALAALPNLAFLEIDTTGLRETDEIVRVTLLDGQGQVIEDCLIKPARCRLGREASAVNGVKPEELEDAPTLPQVWPRIRQAFAGRYVLSFNQRWDREKLDQAAEQHHLTPLVVIGECVQQLAQHYFQEDYRLSLADLCARAGAPLPPHPQQTSLDRARGQRAVLHAFANAVMDRREAVTRTGIQASTPHFRDEDASDEDALP